MDDLDWDAINPATGPVFVEGAKAGGALKVRIDNIEFDEQTCSATGQDEGVCGNRFDRVGHALLQDPGQHAGLG